jgi:hypothetical protein
MLAYERTECSKSKASALACQTENKPRLYRGAEFGSTLEITSAAAM